MITYDDFKKIDLRVGTIKEAVKVEGSDKLVKLSVDLGPEIGIRTIVAGIGKKYSPDILIGRQIVVIVNLEPRSLMGVESQGMLLAASGAEGPILLSVNESVLSGATIS
jgi:methionine--tRNA ligase beta chain